MNKYSRTNHLFLTNECGFKFEPEFKKGMFSESLDNHYIFKNGRITVKFINDSYPIILVDEQGRWLNHILDEPKLFMDFVNHINNGTEIENVFAAFVIYQSPNGLFASVTRLENPDSSIEQATFGLPGGKLEKGETMYDAAVRESIEEGWEMINVSRDVFHIGYVDRKLVVWFIAQNTLQLQEYKEKERGIKNVFVEDKYLYRTQYNTFLSLYLSQPVFFNLYAQTLKFENKTRLYFDTEFTGLHKDTTLISIGIISDDGRTFYAELNDYDKTQVDDWLEENVIQNLKFAPPLAGEDEYYMASKMEPIQTKEDLFFNYSVELRCNKSELKNHLTKWLKQFEKVEMYSDCLAYDWILFNDIFGHAFNIPKNVYYIPFDLSTALKLNHIDPDISRLKFSLIKEDGFPHNALFDAKMIKACFERLRI